MKNIKTYLLSIILVLFFNISFCQQKSVYEKKVEEILWQFYKQLGVSQSQIDNAEKTHNIEEINAVIKELCTTNKGIEKYSNEMIRLTNELQKAETLKTETEVINGEIIKNKKKELEEFNRSDYSKISKNIKSEFEKWLTKSEFEKQENFIKRVKENNQIAFDSICYYVIQNTIKNKLDNSHKPELEIGRYDAEQEYFKIKIKIFNIEIEDTLNIKISEAENFKKYISGNELSIPEGEIDWFINNNNLFPKVLTFKINNKQYLKNIQNNKPNIKGLDFSSNELDIKNENFSELKFDYKKYQENTAYNTDRIDVKPNFPGGMEKFFNFIAKYYKVPKEGGLKGIVYVAFVVEKDGSLTNVRVLKDIGYGTGEEAVRVLNTSPKWNPGEKNGEKVRCTFGLPISIQSAE